MTIHKKSITGGLPPSLDEEWIQELAAGHHVKIERIVSKGHKSPDDFWYDQRQNEWVLVLEGNARLFFEEGMQHVEMKAGDYLMIPSGKKHRVTWTDPLVETIWLAVFFD